MIFALLRLLFPFLKKRDMLDQLNINLDSITEHSLFCGSSGSGKTSTMKKYLIDILKRGGNYVSGVFCAVKPDEIANIKKIVWGAGQQHRFIHLKLFGDVRYNFLAFDLKHFSPRVAVKRLLDLNRLLSGGSNDNEQAFWVSQFEKMLYNGVLIGKYSLGDKFHVGHLYHIITSSPASYQQAASKEFREKSVCCQLIEQIRGQQDRLDVSDRRLFNDAMRYFMQTSLRMGDRTRGSIEAMVNAVLSPFLEPGLFELTCTEESNFSPEQAINGYLVALDFPIMTMGDGGRFIQALITGQVVDLALSRANPEGITLVVRDELPEIIGDPDKEVSNFALARSQKVAFFSGIQSIPNLQEKMGGTSGEKAMLSLLSNHGSHFVFSNKCPETNKTYSEAFGTSLEEFVGVSEEKPEEEFNLLNTFMGHDGLRFSISSQYTPRVPIENFSRMRRGGDVNKKLVDFYLSQAGRSYGADDSPCKLMTIKQV